MSKVEVDEKYVEKAEQWRRSLGGTQKALAKAKQRVDALEEENTKLRELVDKLLESKGIGDRG